MYRYLLFDLDGTLTDPFEGITKSVQFALSHFGMERTCAELRCFIGPPLTEQFMSYAHMTRAEAEEAVRFFRLRFTDTGIFENALLTGVPEMLSRLQKAGCILCVASSKPEVFVRRILDRYEIADFFTVVTGSELDGTRTDKAEVIEETLSRLAYTGDRQDVLMIGDRIHDVHGAGRLGIDALALSCGYAEPGELENSDAVAVVVDPCAAADWILEQQ